jgi:uncharacterized membrane-anchored protein
MQRFVIFIVVMLPVTSPTLAFASQQQEELGNLPWKPGPLALDIGEFGTLSVGDGYRALDPENTRRWLELSEVDAYVIMPEQGKWLSYFSFYPIGHVKDYEKINADQLFKEINTALNDAGDIDANGWAVKPHYDKNTNRLEYGVRQKDLDDNIQLLYVVTFLGRHGVMTATFMGDISTLNHELEEFKTIAFSYRFFPDQSYSAYRPGDKVAEYGLGRLIMAVAIGMEPLDRWAILAELVFSFGWKLAISLGVGALPDLVKLFSRKISEKGYRREDS